MGIVNVTPDSFSDGGQFSGSADAVDHALRLEDEGADILDIGGESTRPGSDTVAADDELERVIPVVAALAGRTSARISIDTRKATVMQAAADAGAHVINDVSALTFDPDALTTAARTRLPVVLMHAQGDPKTMQVEPHYDDVVGEVLTYLSDRIAVCVAAGINRKDIAVDPGIGFGKTIEHNLKLMHHLDRFCDLRAPVLLGASRKRFIGTLGGVKEAAERVHGSVAAALAGAARGARIVRVHDVAATRQAFAVFEAVQAGHVPGSPPH